MSSPRPMESTEGIAPAPGLHVYTRDGHELGTVKEIAEESFKVDASMKRDYWLSFGSILSINRRGVEMDFDHDRLEDFQLDAPDTGAISESPGLDATGDTFASPEEKELMRERQIHGGSGVNAEIEREDGGE